jgi:hypothetical protein
VGQLADGALHGLSVITTLDKIDKTTPGMTFNIFESRLSAALGRVSAATMWGTLAIATIANLTINYNVGELRDDLLKDMDKELSEIQSDINGYRSTIEFAEEHHRRMCP